MCGIAGFVSRERVDPFLLERMCDSLYHRGPDEDGYYATGKVALGIRRLAIIDLETGGQPIFNEDGSIAVVFNGEIYNFLELRRKLEARGHRFRTNADTECIVHLYEDHGEACVEHLRGMFAFALWDARRSRLVLARDRVGKKPLAYRISSQGISFASEVKALLQDPSFERKVDPVALHHYLTYQYVPAPWTMYSGVCKLPPAHTLVYQDGGLSLRRYWRLSYADKMQLDEQEAGERVRDLIRAATRIRLLSERPVGVFLSGGVDSSLVATAMAEQSAEPIKTFSIGFADKRFDELEYARLVARHISSEHHEMVVDPSALDVLPTLIWHYDEPFADSSAIPSYYVSHMAAEHVTVALNGDGGDESFGGYERYVANLLGSRLRVPAPLAPLGAGALRALPQGKPGSFLRRARRFLEPQLETPAQRYLRWICYFDNRQKNDLYTRGMAEAVEGVDSYELVSSAFEASDAPDLVDRTLSADVQTYLPGDLLVKMDIATMANSLEARSPLLDQEVMEFAAALPSNMKIRGLKTKYLLKRAARGWLPSEVLKRRKMGFGVPLSGWLRGELNELVRDNLTDATARERGFFEPASVRRLIAEHDRGFDHSSRIWALLQFELWHRTFIDQQVPNGSPTPMRQGERTERWADVS